MPYYRRGTNNRRMSFKLIQGVYYSEHNMKGKFDNKYIIKAVTEGYKKRGVELSNSRPESVHPQHTFYEDVNIPEDIYASFVLETIPLVNKVCNTDSFSVEDIWGHLTKPGQQTMVHAHKQVGGLQQGLSSVYYPHIKKNMGNLHFIVDVGNNRVIHEVKVKANHLYIFSRDILHFTPINATKTNRVSISGNFGTDWSFLDTAKLDNNFFKYIGRNCHFDQTYNR